jgi:predicted MFS family arabinose efflux permease
VVFAGTGISLALVQPMSRALIGQLFSMRERPQVIGYLNAGGALSFVIGSQVLNVLDDWRLTFSLFLFPLTLVSFVLALKGIPSASNETPSNQRFFRGLRAVVRTRSAVACVIANVLFIMAFRVISFYEIPFLRQQFFVDKGMTSFIVSGVALVFMAGSVLGGQLVNRFGRKPLTVGGSATIGVLVLAFVNVPSLWMSLVLYYIAGFTSSIRNAAYGSLAIEQVPRYRGTMMSLSLFASHLAQALGNGLGGLLLILFDYQFMGVLGIAAFIAAVVFHVFTIDPTTQAKQQETNNT